MNKSLVAIAIVLIVIGLPFSGLFESDSNTRHKDSKPPTSSIETVNSESDRIIQSAFDQKRSKLQVQGKAVVYRLLPDDLKGDRHQKFLLRLSTGLSLQIAHNIDLAPRLNGLQVGDTVEFYGVYEWNDRGGVVHWTHHDPQRRHVGGWLKYNGYIYE